MSRNGRLFMTLCVSRALAATLGLGCLAPLKIFAIPTGIAARRRWAGHLKPGCRDTADLGCRDTADFVNVFLGIEPGLDVAN